MKFRGPSFREGMISACVGPYVDDNERVSGVLNPGDCDLRVLESLPSPLDFSPSDLPALSGDAPKLTI